MLNPSNIETLIGKKSLDTDVESFLRGIDSKAEWIEEEEYNIRTWLSRQAGIEIRADFESGQITHVYLYGPRAKKFGQFHGVLSRGLSTDMTRDELQFVLGPTWKTGPTHDAWVCSHDKIMTEYGPDGKINKLVFGIL